MLPHPQTPSEKLAAILLELNIWARAKDQIMDLIGEIGEHVRFREGYFLTYYPREDFQSIAHTLLWPSVADQVWAKAWLPVAELIGVSAWNHYTIQVMDQLEVQVYGKVKNHLFQGKSKLDYNTLYCDAGLDTCIAELVNFTFGLNQLVSMSMRAGIKYKSIHSNFAQFIVSRIPENQIEDVLDQFEISHKHENFMVESHFKILRKYLN